MKLYKVTFDMWQDGNSSDEDRNTKRVQMRKAVTDSGITITSEGSQWFSEMCGYTDADTLATAMSKNIKVSKVDHVYTVVDATTTFQTFSELPLSNNTYNSKCDVHMSGNTMTSFNEVMLLENCCTDRLQENLNQGWRMITVNVQDASRSDYVLGRYKYHSTDDTLPLAASRGV